MATDPKVIQIVQDGGIGILPASPDYLHAKAGVSSFGPFNQAVYIPDLATLTSIFGTGPAVAPGAYHLKYAGPYYHIRTPTSTNGTIGAVTKTAATTSTGTMAVALSVYSLHAQMAAGAALDVRTGFTTPPITGLPRITLGAGGANPVNYTLYSLDPAGNQQSEVIVAAGPGDYTATKAVSAILRLTSNVDPVGTTDLVLPAVTPADAYPAIVKIVRTGQVGVSPPPTFILSLDGGLTYSSEIAVPVSGVYDVYTYAPGGLGQAVGFKLTFTNGLGPKFLEANDRFDFATTAPTWNSSDLTGTLNALIADDNTAQNISGVHIVGASDGTIFTIVDAIAEDAAFNKYRPLCYFIEAPGQGNASETTWANTLIATTYANCVSRWITVIADDTDIYDPSTGLFPKRNWAAAYVARTFICPISENPSHVECETQFGIKTDLPGIKKLYQTDVSRVRLNNANFTTLRTYPTRKGYYATQSVQMAPAGSDFLRLSNRRTMNVAMVTAYDATLPFLQGNLLADTATGNLDEFECRRVESKVGTPLRTVLKGGQRQHVSDVSIRVRRDTNFLADATIYEIIEMVPRGTVDKISQSIGFKNPALQVT